MNVFGTVMTSSPGPTPKAKRLSQSASVPLPTPIACGQSQYAAKSASNRATNGPPAKAPSSMTSWIAPLNSLRKGAWWDLRSKKGTLVCIILSAVSLGSRATRWQVRLPRHSYVHRFSVDNLPWFRGRAHFTWLQQCHGTALTLERCRRSLEDSYQFQPFASTGQGLGALFDAIEKMLTLGSQWLLLFYVRDVAVPIVIGVVKVGECVVMRRALHPHIIYPNFFVRLQIVVNDHASCTYDGHFANLSGLEPTALGSGKSLVPKSQRDVGHVLDTRSDMGVTLAIDDPRKFSKDMQDD